LSTLIRYIFVVAVAAVLANTCYMYCGLYDTDIKKCHAEIIYALDSLGSKDEVLYFGESSNFTTVPGDSSQESISQLAGRLSGIEIGTINQSASHAGTYERLISRLDDKKGRALVVTMNLRSFGINWIESDLETNLSRANILYSKLPPVLKKCLVAFKAYDNKAAFERKRTIQWHYKHDVLFIETGKFKTVKEWDAYMFSKGHLDKDGNRDAEACELACQYIKNYAFVIDDRNPRVKNFDQIVNYCAAHGITLIFHLLPENVEKSNALCGGDLLRLMQRNAAYLQERYASKSVFVNNLSLLADSCFIDKAWPTEHYIFYGRKKVAAGVAKALRSTLKR